MTEEGAHSCLHVNAVFNLPKVGGHLRSALGGAHQIRWDLPIEASCGPAEPPFCRSPRSEHYDSQAAHILDLVKFVCLLVHDHSPYPAFSRHAFHSASMYGRP